MEGKFPSLNLFLFIVRTIRFIFFFILYLNYNISRFQQAWDTCRRLNDNNEWLKLAEGALVNLNLEIGKYRFSFIARYFFIMLGTK